MPIPFISTAKNPAPPDRSLSVACHRPFLPVPATPSGRRFQSMKRVLAGAAAAALLCASASHAQTGMRQLQANGMPITVIYPTAAIHQSHESGPFRVQVALDSAPLLSATGLRHLIVLSHGTGGSPWPDHQLAATLARDGFVVAQPLHKGDNWTDAARSGPESWKTRHSDIRQTIDALLQDPVLGPLIHPQKVGVHGMSAGAVPALSLAGAQWRMLNLIQHCAQHMDADVGFCLNGLGQDETAQQARRQQFVQAKGVPEVYMPAALKTLWGGLGRAAADPRPDQRVAAISLAVPVAAIFTAESLSNIGIPVGLTTAAKDGVLAPQFHSQHVLAHCRTCTVLSALENAGHFDVLSPWPDAIARSVASQQMRGGQAAPALDAATRQLAFDRISDFFKANLKVAP